MSNNPKGLESLRPPLAQKRGTQTARGEGDAGTGLTGDPEGAVIAHHLLRLGHHRAAEPVATGAWLAAAGVMRVVVETNGAVGTFNVRILVP